MTRACSYRGRFHIVWSYMDDIEWLHYAVNSNQWRIVLVITKPIMRLGGQTFNLHFLITKTSKNEARSSDTKPQSKCDQKRLSHNPLARFAKHTQRCETSAKSSSTKNDRCVKQRSVNSASKKDECRTRSGTEGEAGGYVWWWRRCGSRIWEWPSGGIKERRQVEYVPRDIIVGRDHWTLRRPAWRYDVSWEEVGQDQIFT